MQAGVDKLKSLAYRLPILGYGCIIQLFIGMRKGKPSNCSGLRMLFEYRLEPSLIKMITVNVIKPVL